MKRLQQTWLLFVAVACMALPRVGAGAQDAEAPADATPVAKTNAPDADSGLRRGPLVVFRHDVELKAGEEADAVVVFGGNARIHGKVNNAVVAIFGDVEVTNEVENAVVAILGNIKLSPGAHVNNAVVSILGDVEVDKGAEVDNAAVAVGGRVDAQDGAKIRGTVNSLDVPKSIKTWVIQCVLKLRPLAPQVGWVWLIAGAFFLIYVFITILFPRPVQASVAELVNRPATTFFAGLVTKLLMPVVFSILAVTVAGGVVIPFLFATVLLGAIVGKAALLQYIGLRFGRLAPGGTFQKPLLALLIGALFITVLYMVPVLGLLTFMLVSIWGLGGAVLAAFGGLRREMPARPAAAAPTSTVPPMAFAPQGQGGGSIPGVDPMAPSPTSAVPPPDALSFPRARFLERMAAGILDIVLVSIVCKLSRVHGFWPVVMLAYFAIMWTWKNTTIGGIILGLKVARVDGRPLTFSVALVRALGAAFSIIVLFLGFLWIAWDRDKQGWHDQIAGTVVVRLPRGTPLVCF